LTRFRPLAATGAGGRAPGTARKRASWCPVRGARVRETGPLCFRSVRRQGSGLQPRDRRRSAPGIISRRWRSAQPGTGNNGAARAA